MEFHSVACPFCSLHCDDLHLNYDGGRWKLISPACSLASRQFKKEDPVPGGTYSRSIQNATKILDKAHHALIVLTGDVEQEAVIPALNLARATSAYLVRDNGNSGENISNAMQRVGLLSGTIADFSEQTDQVVILGDDPEKILPRFWEFIGNKKKDKTVWVNSRQSIEIIQHLRLCNLAIKTPIDEKIKAVATRISKAHSGVVFVSSESVLADANPLTEILLWVKEIGESQKWFSQVLSPLSNEAGISQALRLTTGYSGGMSFRKGNIYHDPRSFQLEKLIEYHEADVVIIVGGASQLPKSTLQRLEGFKTITLSPEESKFHSDAWVPCAQVGVDAPGTMQRFDGIPIKFETLINSGRATARDFLDQLTQRVNA
jgi:formylmethanofuran dehydrogenase subunit B